MTSASFQRMLVGKELGFVQRIDHTSPGGAPSTKAETVSICEDISKESEEWKSRLTPSISSKYKPVSINCPCWLKWMRWGFET